MNNQYFRWLQIGAIVLAAVLAILAVLFLIKAVRGRQKLKTKLFNITSTAVCALGVVLIVLINYFTGVYANSINAVMLKTTADEAETDVSDWKNLAYSIAEEGMVLLENKNGTLPLKDVTKVNLLGYYAYNPYYSGSGSGNVSATDSVSIVDSLKNAGIEVNPALETSGIYKTVEAEKTESIGFMTASFSIDEVSSENYTGDVSFSSMKDYSDTAIVVLGRTGGEGADLTAYEDGDYLHLTENEEALLASARETFDTVIVIVNSANALEMGWVQQYDVDAVVWAGIPGPYGFEALGEILTGAVNPSGHLPDTWVYDNDSAPANENFGIQAADNADGRYYVDYVEGIYVGYKWYETAYAEGAQISNVKTGTVYDYTDYDSIVAYPFGYGLSYTTFTEEITGGTLTDGTALQHDGAYTVDVTVTNTGDIAGKAVVQLYVTAPYTEYDQTNGVEKAAVSLVNYGKTSELEPGASETVTIDVNMEDIASYDSSYNNPDGTTGAYMLDAGDYKFSVRSDAHTELDAATANLEETFFYSGDSKRSTDQQTASNQFDEAARGEYLSRKNGFENYTSAMQSVSSSIKDTTYATTNNVYDDTYDTAVTKTYTEGVDYAVQGSLTLDDMKGLDYDDENWDLLVSQLTLDELKGLTGNTMYSSIACPSIDKQASTDSDGPLGISSMFTNDLITVAFPCIPLLSATFNKDLAHEMGSCVADQAEINSITMWYAPAMDTHRSAYSGRNFEYYSEDAALGAYTASAEVAGAREKGLICVIKHFALNDMESNRNCIHTYSNEQAIREIYLKPFEAAVKDGGATAVMNSMNYVGDVYVGAHEGLLTEVLRNEWGFNGLVLTDMDEAGEIRSFWSTIRAGVDVWLGMNDADLTQRNDADIYYLQRAAKNILYTFANGNTYKAEYLNWQLYRNLICVMLGVLSASCAVALVIRNKKEKDSVK